MKLQDFDFRIWDKERKYCGDVVKKYNHISRDFSENAEVELWSGFYDKNDKRIYEGDIVRYSRLPRNLVIMWAKNTFHIIYPDTKMPLETQLFCGIKLQNIYDNEANGYKDNKLDSVEVIGNIHENKELLWG